MPGHRSTSRSRADVRATVLLDLYGTLVEPHWPKLMDGRTAIAERAGLSAAAAHRAWDMTHATRMTGTYGSLADDLAEIFSQASDGSSPAISASLLSQLADEERENWSRGVTLYPDAMPALILLRSLGLRIAIVTNASAEAASVVDSLGLRTVVDEVFASCEAGLLKPDLLLVALRSLGVAAADTTLVDDGPAQLEGAARLGMGTILVQRAGAEASTEPDPPAINDLRQLADLLGRPEPARRR
jgi:HAD superfamily hydrolase (TIGR01509 family)